MRIITWNNISGKLYEKLVILVSIIRQKSMGAVFKNTLLLKTTNYMKFHNNISDVMTGYSDKFCACGVTAEVYR